MPMAFNSNNAPSNEDLYALLNLSHQATATDIQRSYKVSCNFRLALLA